MTAYTENVSKHATLAADTEDTVEITSGSVVGFRITNRAGSGDGISYTFSRDGTQAAATKAGDDTYLLPAGASDTWDRLGWDGLTVSLISATADAYSVETW